MSDITITTTDGVTTIVTDLLPSNAAVASAAAAAVSAGTATTQAGNATTSAGTATTQAGIATTQAGIATTQAGNASTSASASAGSASTATTEAGIATTQAGTATTQAGIATTQAGIATAAAAAAASGTFGAVTMTHTRGSIAADLKVYDGSVTWNNAAITFTGWKFNLTNTASASGSKPLDFQIGGVSCLSMGVDGNLVINQQTGAVVGNPLTVKYGGVTKFTFNYMGGLTFSDAASAIAMAPSGFYDWSGGVALYSDSTYAVGLRRATNPCALNTYGTFTDASNYRRVSVGMSAAGVATLNANGAGTGASGNVLHISSLPTSNPGPGILWNNAGTPAIGT